MGKKVNWPFPSCCKPLFQSEAKSEATDMTMIFHSHSNKTHLYKKGFALSLVLKVRLFATRKWYIKSVRDSIRKKIKKSCNEEHRGYVSQGLEDFPLELK